jgi:ArsR family transcriptional regulator, arsenate/arsenite/antimonite-responsive transcriptional repressor / arsenate reductase (thioredoxin)
MVGMRWVAADLADRAERYAALGDPVRLAIVDELGVSDRAPGELQTQLGLSSNLLAHHLDVLERAGLISRLRSSGDRRRRYIRLERDLLPSLNAGRQLTLGVALFVCTHNSARSQLAAALWAQLTGLDAMSAGTSPAERIHPGAVASARRAGLDLGDAKPRRIRDIGALPPLVITVCDRAHEELDPEPHWLHWSISDPLPAATRAAFDSARDELHQRIRGLTGRAA